MSFKRPKLSIIGAGFTGQATAVFAAQKALGDIVLLDIPNREGWAKGQALDLLETTPILAQDLAICGTSDFSDTKNSDLVIITAGLPRKPGMSREDLMKVNAGIVKDVTKKAVEHSPDCIIVVLSNPVDSMTYTALKVSGFPKNRVIGQSGVLDTARYITFLAQALNCSVEDISALVLGGHGDDMVPLVRLTLAGGIPVGELLPREKLDAIVERTRKGGGEIVNLMGTSAGWGPGASLIRMAESIIKDKKRILPSIALLDGEYGYRDLCLGVPTVLGGNGIERVIELQLTADEKAALDKSAAGVRQSVDFVKANVL